MGNPGGKKVSPEKKAKSLVFQALSNVPVGELVLLDRMTTTMISPWSVGRLEGQALKLGAVTKKHIVSIATHGGKIKLNESQRKAVRIAWNTIREAQASGRRIKLAEHTTVVNAQRAREAPTFPEGDELRELLVQKHGFLRLGFELQVKPSTIALLPDGQTSACNGLFTEVDIPKGELVTYYDGIDLALGQDALERHQDRAGWFVCHGRTSKNSAVVVGFTSSDRLSGSPCAGVMSLTNSASGAGANCERHDLQGQPFRLGGVFLDSLICLRAKRDIRAGEELAWTYCVRF
jgi:hypothetical protein